MIINKQYRLIVAITHSTATNTNTTATTNTSTSVIVLCNFINCYTILSLAVPLSCSTEYCKRKSINNSIWRLFVKFTMGHF